jgi:DNA segregation ATPase FtsK/SpoIIIE, S-DNA-T family
MHHPNTWRRVLFVIFACGWLFFLLSLASFHPTDWPSHAVYPYQPVQNLCGNAGAFVGYWTFLVLGQGIFPILFFSGICLGLYLFGNRVSDVWLRTIGTALLSIAFASAVHLIRPGSRDALPEGTGGLIGISTSGFLRAHCNALVTSLILACAFLVGLLLAADDLVVRVPGFVGSAISTVKLRTPPMRFRFPQLPKLPALPRFVTRDAVAEEREAPAVKAVRAVKASVIATNSQKAREDEEEDYKPPVLIKPGAEMVKLNGTESAKPQTPAPKVLKEDEEIHLEYDNDDPAPAVAAEAAVKREEDPEPAEPAVIPPPAEQAVAVPPPAPRPDIVVKLPSMFKPRNEPPPPPKELGEYQLPGWDCLAEAERGYAESQEKFVREKAAELEQTLKEFEIDAHVVEIDTGPVITMYELALAAGVKVSAISALSNDIQRALKAETIRIVAPIPGKATVGIEVPNEQKEKVRLKELMQLTPPEQTKDGIPIFLGKDASGEPLIAELTKMPHGLIAGTTGSGKSVCINSIIMSIMYLQRPDRVKLILIDPKVVEMAPFKDIPHLMCPIINDAGRATSVLEWACEKMDERYEFLAEAGVRNLKSYNSLTQEELIERFQPGSPEEEAKIPKKLPYIVIIVDELADLMMTSGKEVESHIVRLAQKARAVGIHLILATQRPQATVVTGLIKANMPCKIAFRVSSKMDSRIVLDMNGAEVLLGQGDMLFLPPGASKPIRGQGTYIDDKEMKESVKIVKGLADAQYEPELVQIKGTGTVDEEAAKDELFDAAVRVVLETKRGSVSLLQRRLTIGYGRASRLIEAMAAAGIVGSYKGSQAREAQITVEEWEAMRAQMLKDQEEGMTA